MNLDKVLYLISEAYCEDKDSPSYGCSVDNDVLMIHQYCWCDKEDCPWCGYCEHAHEEVIHKDDCYQWKVYRDMIAAGFKRASWAGDSPSVEKPKSMNYAESEKISSSIRKKWCEALELPYPHGSAVHCTCGAMSDYITMLNACECDYCTGSGIFGEHGADPKTRAPNFWYKPLDFKVWWYKHIGRGMKTNKTLESGQMKEMLIHCLEASNE